MAHRRESEQRVELFPFLAVLVCAMGALILLLLVMTRRIRQQAELRVDHERQQLVAAAAEPSPAPPVLAIPAPLPAAVAPSPPKWTPSRKVVRRPISLPEPPPVYVDPTYDQRLAAQQVQHQQLRAALEAEWQQRVNSLVAQRDQLEGELRQVRDQLATRQQSLQSMSAQQQELNSAASETASSADHLKTELADLGRRSDEVRQEIDAVGRQLDQIRSERAAQASKSYTIIPFDARSGTTRRPIVLVCDRDSITLACEGIALTAADLNGFIPHYNPLSAGVRTLVDGWSGKDAGEQPYVLLVVRPEGTVAFYAARTFLQPLNIPFGYELVGAGQQFSWPQTENWLVRECQRSIEEVLRDRSRVAQLSRASGRLEEPLQVLGQGGTFRLDEVERMRQPGRNVQFGGVQLDRDKYTAGGKLSPSGTTEVASDRRGLNIFRRPETSGEQAPNAPRTTAPANPAADGAAEAASSASDDIVSADSNQPSRGWNPSLGFGRGGEVRDPYAWRPPRSSGISIARDIPVELSSKSLRIAGGQSVALTSDIEVESLGRLVAQGLEDQLAAWGDAPRGFYWSPRVKLIVTADAAVLSGKLAPLFETWGVESTLDYASKFSRSPQPAAVR
ncbi:MAG: hypothetical protein ACK5Q5_11795 [Planctomycetaceae bacterium]